MVQEFTSDSKAGETPASVEERIALLEEVVGRQRDTISTLREEVTTLRRGQEEVGESTSRQVQHGRRVSRTTRRKLLKLGGAAAAAGVTAGAVGLAKGVPTAQASSGQSWVLGAFNTAGANTGLIPDLGNITALDTLLVVDSRGGGQTSGVNGVVAFSSGATGVSGNDDANGFGVNGTSNTGTGVQGISNTFDGVLGISGTGAGVEGRGSTLGGTGAGVYGQSQRGPGLLGIGATYAVHAAGGGLAPLFLGPALNPGPPTGNAHSRGELYVDSNGILWMCAASGTPGTWVRLTGVANGASGGAITFLSSPIRIFDTRAGQPAPLPTSKHPLASGSTTTIQVTGTTVGGLSVPAGAGAVVGNLTVTNTQGPGVLILYPTGTTQPLASNINYLGGQTLANFAMVRLSAGGAMNLYVLGAGTDALFDVAGYLV